MQRRDCRLGGDGDKRRRLAVGHALETFLVVIGDLFAELVLALTRHRHERMLGGHHRLHGAVRAPLREHAVEMAMHGERIGGHLLRGAGVPIAHHLGDVELVAGAFHDFAEADMAVTIDRIARQAAHLEDIAGFLARFINEPFGGHTAHLFLVLVDHHHLVGVEDVVEGHHHHIVFVGEADDAVEAVGRHRDGDDGVKTLIDEVLHGAELRCNIGAGGNDLEFLDVLLDARLLGKGLGGLHHLDAPGIADEAVDEGDLVGAGLLVPLEVLGLIRPGLEAAGIGTRPGDDLGACPSTD